MGAVKKCAGCVMQYGLIIIAVIVLVSPSIFAQLPTGTYYGTVKDPQGGLVAGATVTVTNVDTGATRTQPSSDEGTYRFDALLVGRYEIKVTKDGFQTTQRTGLTLVVGQTSGVDVTLQVGSQVGVRPLLEVNEGSPTNSTRWRTNKSR